jgi:hypothetical protein
MSHNTTSHCQTPRHPVKLHVVWHNPPTPVTRSAGQVGTVGCGDGRRRHRVRSWHVDARSVTGALTLRKICGATIYTYFWYTLPKCKTKPPFRIRFGRRPHFLTNAVAGANRTAGYFGNSRKIHQYGFRQRRAFFCDNFSNVPNTRSNHLKPTAVLNPIIIAKKTN